MTNSARKVSRRGLLVSGGGLAALALTQGVAKAAGPSKAGVGASRTAENAAQETIVDRYGQMTVPTWPTKVTSDAELQADVAADTRYYGSLPEPSSRDSYGGEAHTRSRFGLTRTGWFHVENHNGRSYLVDPEGNQFFSLGVSGLGYVGDTYTETAGRESLYEWLPSSNDPLAAAWMEPAHQNYSFYVANQIRKYGSYDLEAYWARQVSRVQALGYNTAGSFSTPATIPNPKIPYVTFVGNIPDHQIGASGLYDVYRQGIKEELEAAMASNLSAYRNDPYLIGYMFFSELDWSNLRNGITQAQASQAATKAVLVSQLQDWYSSNVATFNSAWNMNVSSFDALLEMQFSVTTDAAVQDITRFSAQYLDAFYALFADAIRKADPNHMVIGDRWLANVIDDNTLLSLLSAAAGKHLDALTYDYYTWDPSLERLGEIYRLSGHKALIFTEFHYGETSHGLTFAVRMANSELQKGQFYRNYVENVAASGMVVGAHWFEYLDEAATGRWFQGYAGEAGAIGLLDVTDRPYKTMLSQVVRTNDAIYSITDGRTQPYKATFSAGQIERQADQVTQIPKATTAPIIDGSLDATWPDGPTIELTPTDLVIGLATAGVQVDFRLAWDAANLYVHATVNDPTPMLNPNHGFDIWNGDAIELFIGPDNVEQGGGIQVKDSQIIISAQPQDASGGAEYFWYNDRQDQPHIDAIVKPATGGYTIEAAIPLAALNISAATAPQKLRFDIGLDDGNGSQRQSQLIWNGTASDSSTRDKWGYAWLVDAVSSTPPGQTGPSHPAVSYSTLDVHPGQYIQVSATALNPGERLPVLIDDTRLGTLTGAADGSANWWVRTPSNIRPGAHTISISQDSQIIAQAMLLVQP